MAGFFLRDPGAGYLRDPAGTYLRTDGGSATATDDAGLTDSFTAVVLAQTSTDDASLTDVTSWAMAFGSSAADDAGLVDATSTARGIAASADDHAGLTDAVIISGSGFFLATDDAGLADDYAAALGLSATATDVVGLVDSSSSAVEHDVTADDPAGLSDDYSTVTTGPLTYTVTDDVGLFDWADYALYAAPSIMLTTGGTVKGGDLSSTNVLTSGGTTSPGTTPPAFGLAVDSVNSTYAASWAKHYTQFGHVEYLRWYSGSIPTAWPTPVTTNPPDKLFVSCKSDPATTASGAFDTAIATFAATIPAGAYVSWQHEPDQPSKGISYADFAAGFARFYDLVKATQPNCHVGTVMQTYTFNDSAYSGSNPWFAACDMTKMDFIGLDAYSSAPHWRSLAAEVAGPAAYARALVGNPAFPVVLPEYNQAVASGREAWLAAGGAWFLNPANHIDLAILYDATFAIGYEETTAAEIAAVATIAANARALLAAPTVTGSSPVTTGGTTVAGSTTGGTTTTAVVTTGADYAVHHGYCKLGLVPGYIVGTGGTGDLHTALLAFEALAGQKLEVFSRGLPNNMGDATSSLLQAQGCPQLGVWAAPLVPMGSGSIALGLLGTYDALIDATADAMIKYRPGDILRLGWEFLGDFYNWGLDHIDPHTGHPNTLADILAMQRHFITRARNRGFKGLFDLNGGTTDLSKPTVSEWWAGDSYGDIVGIDVYNGISRADLYTKADFQQVWDNEIKPELDRLVSFARAHGKYVGFGEAGVLSQPNNPYHTDDTPLFWQYMQAYCKANADVILYICTWNQNQSSNGVVTEEGQIAYSGSVTGQSIDANGGTLHNTSTHGPWVWTPSPNLAKSMASWRQYMKTGSMQASGVTATGNTSQTTTGGTTTGGTTTGGVTQLANGSVVRNAVIVGGTSTGGTLLGGTLSGTVVTGGTVTGGTLVGGVLSGGTYSLGSYSGGTLQPDGTWTGGTLVGGTSVNGTVTGGISQLPDGSTVIGGTVTGGVTTGGTTVGGVFDPRTGIVTGGTTTGGVTTGGTVTGGVVVPPGSGPVTVPGGYVPPSSGGSSVPVPGLIGWDYSGTTPDGFKVIAFTGGPLPLKVTFDVPYQGAGRQHLQTSIGDVTQFSWVIYPYAGSLIGEGGLYTEGWFLDPPTAGSPPLQSSPPAPGTLTVTNQTTSVVTVLGAAELNIGYVDTSNDWYVGGGEDVSVYGHTPRMALDDDDNSYWLSIGNASQTADNAFEWYEVSVGDQEVTSVRFHNVGTGYFCYVSVYAAGVWVSHNAADIIPYNAADPTSHNGANIPYAETIDCSTAGDGPYEVVLRAPIPKVTRIRLTYHKLQDFTSSVSGGEPYRAALRKIKVFGLVASSSTTTTVVVPPALSPVHDYDSPDVLQSYTTYIPPTEIPGAGEKPGTYEDYTDIIKLIVAWAGFFWPQNATMLDSSGNVTHYDYGATQYGLPNVDPVLGGLDAGRVWGDLQPTGTAGIANLPIPQWDKKSLLDCVSYVRDIIGFLFFIDETGGVIWRLPNIFQVGNYYSSLAAPSGRSTTIVTVDEKQTLIDLRAKMSSRNVRERYFVASTDGKTGALAAGFNANPIGLRRVAGWTDQNFGSNTECLIMADMIALRALMSYRVDTIQIPGYPRLQVDDQIRITERTTAESFLHYVRGISSSLDLETGLWTYDLDTSWLGTDPFNNWAFNPSVLSAELQQYLNAISPPAGATTPPDPGTGSGSTTKDVVKVAKLVKTSSAAAVYITDGITKRHVVDSNDEAALINHGLVSSATVEIVQQAFLDAIPLAP